MVRKEKKKEREKEREEEKVKEGKKKVEKKVFIKIGRRYEGNVEVKRGMKKGEIIINEGKKSI